MINFLRPSLLGWFFAVAVAVFAPQAQGYPEFIGYSYNSCLTCHYNPSGGGPLNDYGRAVWAAEIAARDLIPNRVTDEHLGEYSGFLGRSTLLPWWFRPGFKYRGLWLQTNPGATTRVERFVRMQSEASLALQFDKKGRYVVVGSLDEVDRPTGNNQRSNVWVSREHYLRVQFAKSLFVSVGMMEKIYGIRVVDHTAVNRARLSLDSHQSTLGTLTHGVAAAYIRDQWEVAVHAFAGNLNEDESQRMKGASTLYEVETGENMRTGGSALFGESSTTKQTLIGAHHRTTLTRGSALLAELGWKHEQSYRTRRLAEAIYGLAQTTILLRRGYHLLSQAEYYRPQDGVSNEVFKWGVGLLAFPLPRTEFRFTGTDTRQWSPTQGTLDSWLLQAQIHFAL